MTTHKRVLAAGAAALALGIVVLAGGVRADDDDKDLREQVDKVAAVANSPDNLRKEAGAAAKKLDSLEDVMNLMKKRTKDSKGKVAGGWGVGAKATGGLDDGIEARIQNLAKKAPTKAQLGNAVLVKDLQQMANRTAAIGEIALAKAPTKKEGDKDPKDWKQYSGDMSKSARDLAREVGKGDKADPKMIKDIAARLNGSCTECHAKFRD